MFPDAPVFTAIFNPSRGRARFQDLQLRTSFLQGMPRLGRYYEAVVPLLPLAYENFDLRGFDLVLTSSHSCSKGVIPPADALHVCYCHTPMRYAWSHREEYLERVPMKPLVSPIARLVLARMRRWDFIAAQRVDHYIANSQTVRRRIAKYYRRDSEVVYPPVDLARFTVSPLPPSSDNPYLVVSRLVQYKRVEVAVEACTRLGLPLTVIGDGPESTRLRRLAGPTITFLGEVDDRMIESAYRSCRALIFTADEDFGIVPLEAMACGRPVLALNKGGATETVIDGVTGILYEDAGVEALVEALRAFRSTDFNPAACRARAEEFSVSQFHCGVKTILERELGRSLA
jgi:glycosyltransferase involved in cell wall biosynthesis